ncbi:MAG: trypsin-like peptidase domain-containing protein [Phycisphaerales bacterium]|nr:trypsin-like peptidase domain-containing protein [Phycisphaerales bacterium]
MRFILFFLLFAQCSIGQIIDNPSLKQQFISNSAEECDIIKYIPKSSKPNFDAFLSGVKYAVIHSKAKINGQIPAYNGLEQYLEDIGFRSVRYYGDGSLLPSNACEEVYVDISFDYNYVSFYNIGMTFWSPVTGYAYDFSTNKIVDPRGGYAYCNAGDFRNVLVSMYGYTKPHFNSDYTLKLPKLQTCWTENKIKNYIELNGCDKIEGIYEASSIFSSGTVSFLKYKVAVRKINQTYYLIYLSGAKNTGNWEEGEIKATLEQTATPLFYKVKWIMLDKSVNNDYYIKFEQGYFNLFTGENNKELYIKMFPSSTDNIANLHQEGGGSATGYAITSSGYIVTNYHVTKGATSIQVRGINGDFSKNYTAKVVIEDKNNDLAIIKIDDPSFTTLGTVPYIIASRVSDVGSSVFCLGYPLRATMGDEVKITNGIVSAKTGFQGDVTSYQITTPIQPGNSGGPLFDDNGNIIGTVNAHHASAENVSYAIKTSYLINLINSIPISPKLQTINILVGKPLTEQVKVLKKFVYIIEVN